MSLLLYPQHRWYSPDESVELLTDLDQISSRTARLPINEAQSLALDSKWRTYDGYRYTNVAFKQIATLAARGLGSLAADIAGIERRTESPAPTSIDAAAQIFNLCIRLRMEGDRGLSNYTVVYDDGERTVDAVVGVNYQYLPNVELSQIILDTYSDAGYVFAGACLVGRWLSMVMRQPVPLGRLPERSCYLYQGWHVTNSESSECAVNVSPTYIISEDMRNGICRGRGRGASHTGRKFSKRMRKVIAPPEVVRDTMIGDKITRLRDKKLFSPASAASKSRVRAWVDRIVKHNVPVHAAEMAVAQAVKPCSDRDLSDRNLLDLVLASMEVAVNFYPSVKYTLERWAYAMVSGKGAAVGKEESSNNYDEGVPEENNDEGVPEENNDEGRDEEEDGT